jgi:adenylate kinase
VFPGTGAPPRRRAPLCARPPADSGAGPPAAPPPSNRPPFPLPLPLSAAAAQVLERGWLLDGYPRSGEQAEAIEAEGIRPDVFLLINVPDSLLVDRVAGRRSDPETGEIYHLTFKPPPPEAAARLVQRSDDTEEKVRNRLVTYHRHVDAVLGYYREELVEVDGARGMDEVFGAVEAALDAAAARRQPAGAAA